MILNMKDEIYSFAMKDEIFWWYDYVVFCWWFDRYVWYDRFYFIRPIIYYIVGLCWSYEIFGKL